MSTRNLAQSPVVLISSGKDAARETFTIKIFSNTTDRSDIYGLRHRAYGSAGFLENTDGHEFSDQYDDLPTSYSIGAFSKNVCVGSVRLTFGSPDPASNTMPCQSVFADVPELRSSNHGKFVEFNRMVVAPDISNASFRATLYGTLVRNACLLSLAADADFVLAAVSQQALRFYTSMCGFKLLAAPRSYPGVTFETNLVGLDFRKLEQRRLVRNPFFSIAPEEVERARPIFAPDRVEMIAAE